MQMPTKPIGAFRAPGERAVLVSERHAVWDRRAHNLPLVDEPVVEAGRLGPMPTEWTPDLVHCRLRHVHALACQLPRVKVPAQLRSFLGELQAQDAVPGRRVSLTVEEMQRIDWTIARLQAFGSIDKAVLLGMMSEVKPETISKVTFGIAAREGGKALKRASLYKRYRTNLKALAADWNKRAVPIDDGTRQAWMNEASSKAEK
ncbi:MAG: hypothetical protein KIS73_24700 [Enhydrobacter sp.]|nr:hypothetical protein [Enhydrobacter sp.]